MLYAEFLSFFAARKSEKLMKTVNIEKENLHIEFRNFNEILRKDITCNNIKSHKKQGFILSLKNTFLEKAQGGQILRLSRSSGIDG